MKSWHCCLRNPVPDDSPCLPDSDSDLDEEDVYSVFRDGSDISAVFDSYNTRGMEFKKKKKLSFLTVTFGFQVTNIA